MYGDGLHLGFVVHGYLLVEMKIDACTATIMVNSSDSKNYDIYFGEYIL